MLLIHINLAKQKKAGAKSQIAAGRIVMDRLNKKVPQNIHLEGSTFSDFCRCSIFIIPPNNTIARDVYRESVRVMPVYGMAKIFTHSARYIAVANFRE